MASMINVGEQYIHVSNTRLPTLVFLALEIAEESAESDAERAWVAKLQRWLNEEWFSGTGLDMDELFPAVDEKKFWSKVFMGVADGIFRRELGNQTDTNWQSSAIGDAWIIVRMLTTAIRGAEPATKDTGDEGTMRILG